VGIIQSYFQTKEQKIRGAVGGVLAILLTIFIITQIIRVANAARTPLFANVYEEGPAPTELFPQIAICPGRNATQLAVITNVQCYFYTQTGGYVPITATPSSYPIEGVNYNCYDINQDRAIIATNITDVIRCTVFTDLSVIIAFYDPSVQAPTYWFGWSVLSYGTDSALGIVKWFFQGKVSGYEIQTNQQEYRFNTNDAQYGVAFTVQWEWLGEAITGEFTTYDLWTAIGVVSGWAFLFVQIYKCIFFICSNAFGITEGSTQAPRPLPKNYEAI